ncbi:TerD family protein [Streptomyces sp. CA-294286]|uniref:TerD family protein n=1 Tax=Streptomyces sp. CA-294286 TaxID=3240070 RepID=UPI003D8CE334
MNAQRKRRKTKLSSFNKGIAKVVVTLKWDPSPFGTAASDLDIVAATYRADDPYGSPAYLVHFGSRSPDGTITLNRDSQTGQGFGTDEQMTLELDRLADRYGRVVLGVAIQQRDGRKEFGDIQSADLRILEGYTELARHDFTPVSHATAATVAEFVRDAAGSWGLRELVRGFDADPAEFARLMGGQYS